MWNKEVRFSYPPVYKILKRQILSVATDDSVYFPFQRILSVMYYVYVLYSISYNKTYVGFTGDLSARLISHNELSKKGYTIKYRPWTLLHTEEFEIKKAALLRERELKSVKGKRGY
jgi:putative endonuclease